jgi:hypothetical protein
LLAGFKSSDWESPYDFVGGKLPEKPEAAVTMIASLRHSGGLTVARMLQHVKDLGRNSVAHQGTCNMSIAKYNAVHASIVLFVELAFANDPEATVRLEARAKEFDVEELDLLAKTGLQKIGKAMKVVDLLTEQQAETFDYLGDGLDFNAAAGRNAHVLIQAPSGSGKTLLCTKLAERFIVERVKVQQKRTQVQLAKAVGGDGGDGSASSVDAGAKPNRMLLLTHSAVLVNKTAADIAAALGAGEVMVTTDPAPITNESAAAQPTCICIQSTAVSTIHVLIMTADAFGDAARSEEGVGSFCFAVVDEGHICFGYQPVSTLDGQHQCSNPADFCSIFESALAPSAATPHSTVPVIIFHDDSYQLVGTVPPMYPVSCKPCVKPLPIVRNPGPVRDVSVPFSCMLNTGHLKATKGRQSYHPLHVENCAAMNSGGGQQHSSVLLVNVAAVFMRHRNLVGCIRGNCLLCLQKPSNKRGITLNRSWPSSFESSLR